MAFIAILLSFVLAVFLGVEFYLRTQSEKRLLNALNGVKKKQARQAREIDQLRYAMANLRHLMHVPEATKVSEKQEAKKVAAMSVEEREKQMLQETIAEMSKLSDSLPELEQTKERKDKQKAMEAARSGEPQWTTGGQSSHENKLRDDELLALIHDSVKNNNIDIQLQPIMSVQAEQVRHYEVFSRIRAGKSGYISAGRFLSLAGNEEILPLIDNLLLLRCLQLIRSGQSETSRGYFCNIAASSLENPQFMRTLVGYLEENPRLSSRLIFEMKQKEFKEKYKSIQPCVEELSLIGCRFSIDHVQDMNLDIERLTANNISFVKINADILEGMSREKGLIDKMKKVREVLEASGIEIIAERVEEERQIKALREMDVTYAQGYLLGAPR